MFHETLQKQNGHGTIIVLAQKSMGKYKVTDCVGVGRRGRGREKGSYTLIYKKNAGFTQSTSGILHNKKTTGYR